MPWIRAFLLFVISTLVVSGAPAPNHGSRPDPASPIVLGDVDRALVEDSERAVREGTIEPALRWVSPADVPLLAEALARATAVRKLDTEARTVADEYFVLTVIRLHQIAGGGERAGENDEVQAAIAQAVSQGRADAAVRVVQVRMQDGAAERMKQILAARKKTGGNTAEARLAVADAGDEFARYIERLAIAAADQIDFDDDLE